MPFRSGRCSGGLRVLSSPGTPLSLWAERGCASSSYLRRRRGCPPGVGPWTLLLMVGRWPCIRPRTLLRYPNTPVPSRMCLFICFIGYVGANGDESYSRVQEHSDPYPKNRHRATAPARIHFSVATLRSGPLHGNLPPEHVHQSHHGGDFIPRVRAGRTGD